MRNDSVAENQHYVAKMLLRNFAIPGRKSDEAQVNVFDKEKEKQFRVSVKNIATERSFYEFDIGEWRASIEPHMSKIESEAKPAFEKIIATRSLASLEQMEIAAIAVFVAIQKMRGPQMRGTFRHLNDQLVEVIKKSGADPTEVKGFKPFRDENDIKATAAHFLLNNLVTFSDPIINKRWVLFAAPKGQPFVIGDSPITLHNENDYGPRGNLGLAVRGIQIYLPVSSDLCLGFFCETILQEIADGIAKFDQRLGSHRALRILGNNPDYALLDEKIKKMTAARERLATDLAAYDAGAAVMCSSDNATFLNSLQISSAERFVMSSVSDFALAKDMIKSHPHLKTGPRHQIA